MAHLMWDSFQNNIRKYIDKNGIDNLWNCPEFNQTMFYSSMDFMEERLDLCKTVFGSDLKYVLENKKMPSKDIYGYYTNTNTIHQAFHLANFLNNGGTLNINKVIEFGAGYGELCRIITTLNNSIEYNIIDLQELCYIQEWYLTGSNVSWNKPIDDCDLFIAMWSLSEVPDGERNKYMNIKSKQFMFAFGDSFFDVRNSDYFKSFPNNNPELNWKRSNHPFLSDQYYLLGV